MEAATARDDRRRALPAEGVRRGRDGGRRGRRDDQGRRPRDDDGRRDPARARSPAPTRPGWTRCSSASSSPSASGATASRRRSSCRRLVNQGRLGKKTGQGFFFYPQPDDGFDQKETILLETRDELAILWLNRPPTNPISPQVIRDLTALWDEIESRDEIRAVVIASSNFAVFCAGADIKEFTKMTDPAAGKELLDGGHGVLRRMEQSSKVTIAAVNSLALGGGCELAMACDFRIAAESASFGQPEINLGIIPGFGGTQRLARLVGEAKALEMNLLGEPISAAAGLRARARQRGRPRPRAVRHRARLGAQAGRAGAGGRRADQEGLGEGRPGRGDRGREGRLRDRVRAPRTRARGSRPSSASASRSGLGSSAAPGMRRRHARLSKLRMSRVRDAPPNAPASLPSLDSLMPSSSSRPPRARPRSSSRSSFARASARWR